MRKWQQKLDWAAGFPKGLLWKKNYSICKFNRYSLNHKKEPAEQKRPYIVPKRRENTMYANFSGMYAHFFRGVLFEGFGSEEAFGNLTQPAWCRTSKGKSKEGDIHFCQWQSWLQWANKSSTLDVQKASSKIFTTFVLMDSGTQNLKNPNSQAWCPTSSHMPKRRLPSWGGEKSCRFIKIAKTASEFDWFLLQVILDPINTLMVSG